MKIREYADTDLPEILSIYLKCKPEEFYGEITISEMLAKVMAVAAGQKILQAQEVLEKIRN